MNGLDFDHRVLAAVGEQSRVLRHGLRGRERSAGARGPLRRRRRRAVELLVSARRASAADDRRRHPRHPALLEQAQSQSRRQRHGSLDVRQRAHQRAERRSRALPAELATVGRRAAASSEGRRRSARRRRPTRSRRGSSSRRRRRPDRRASASSNYDWYLKNVQLVPYTWRDEVTLMERELARAHAFLALEEQRNAALPPQAPVASADDYDTPVRRRRSPSTWRSSRTTTS